MKHCFVTGRRAGVCTTGRTQWAAALLATGWVLASAGHAAGRHEHGAARVDVAIEAAAVVVRLESPLENLFGFERAPRTDAERARVAAAMARLRDGAALLRVDPAAGCTGRPGVEIEAPVWATGAAAAGAGATAPAAARTPEPAHAGGHADLEATFTFDCPSAARAAFIDTGFFAAFPGLRRIDVQVAGPRGQAARTLQAPGRRIELAR